ncbi:tRNA-modifying protein YgfZ [Pantoea sp. Mhis]|uniref:tRNA-modifying protein YgfZ n=1 Tax=Pantoea sp. Mhis TaxID=2576759 RepID=UPI00135B4069|nr:tRNA-modifying protein YgfZ [Pantoea sp. Mhis]MXP56678.1 tRNA-modifying protein YgfZ [Pantoea sp. Mhis]
MQSFIFPSNKLSASSFLPLTLISLEEWILVLVQGKNSHSYLQSQLTLNINNMKTTQHYLSAHCNAKGKMLSNIRLFHYRDGYAYLIRYNLHQQQITELNKYAIFSKISITAASDVVLLGVVGLNARLALQNIFKVIPCSDIQVVTEKDTTILWFAQPAERFLIITTLIEAIKLKKQLCNIALLNDSKQWLALDIEAGFPIIDLQTSGKLMPQAANLEALNAISFEKGCYMGQEVIISNKFRGINKRALYWLAGKANKIPNILSSLELQINNQWRKTGMVLSSVQINNDNIWIQSIMNADIKANSNIRITGDEDSKLTIQTLPYTLKNK